MKGAERLRREILAKVREYYQEVFGQPPPFSPGDHIAYGGRVFDSKEMSALVDSSLDFWLTTGRYGERFEREFAAFLGVKHCSLVNSGSSANLLAFMALTSSELGERRIQPGDEVITAAAGFPTTVAPLIQYGAVPVFLDIVLPSYNIDVSQLAAALTDKTKAVMVAHIMGNPFDVRAVKEFCDRYHLWLIEDNCEALGSRYRDHAKWKFTGTLGHLATASFYPSHHMTTGEGGAVTTDDSGLKQIVQSLRDWGRDCRCPTGKENTCQKRFAQKFGELPYGYDHKYVYSHFGYNLKATEMQAAIGCAQLEKLPAFIEVRKKNWAILREGLDDLNDKFILPEPMGNSDPSWFGFLLTVKETAGFSRDQIVAHLEKKGIQTRMLLAGNLIKQPCFDAMRKSGKGYRVAGNLKNTDAVMARSFWIGVYPGMTDAMLKYMVKTVREFMARK